MLSITFLLHNFFIIKIFLYIVVVFQAEHVFKDYPAGVRYIGFFHKGKDRQFWAGHFGAKFTLGSVVIDFSHTALTE